jgi:hypothetical protein
MYSVGQRSETPCSIEAAEAEARVLNREDPVQREPRVLWEVVSIDSAAPSFVTSPQAVAGQVTLRGREWKNGSRHPLTLTHLCLDAVGYSMANQEGLAAAGLTTFHNSRAVLPAVDVRISAPYRQHFTRRPFIGTWGHTPEPAGQPTTRYSTVAASSSMWGINRWEFAAPFWIPRKGSVDFELSAIPCPFALNGTAAPQPQAFVNFEQQYADGGIYPMSSRGVDGETLYASNAGVWPTGSTPTPLDAFGFGLPSPGPTPTVGTMWNHRVSTALNNQWDKQEANRGSTRSWLTSLGVFIDQIAYDAALTAALVAGVTGQRPAPIASRIGARCKTTNGGSNENWWRPGCPLSLLTPTLTGALVHKLPEPIVLAAGDNLEIQLQVPAPQAVAGASPPTLSPTYNIGVSLCGFAEVQ